MIKKFSNKLPTILQTDTQKEFFSATFDQLFSPAEVEQARGFIGRRSSDVFNPRVDNYLGEPTKLRAAYQLEPIAYAVNTALQDTNEVFYEDFLNYIEFRGGDTSNHDRLFADDFYSFAPPIDVDKYLNYQNYLWLEDGGPTIYIQYAGSGGGAAFDSIIETQIIGATQFNTSENSDLRPRGVDLSSGMRIRFEGSSSFDRPLWVEGVGREIRLVEELSTLQPGDSITNILWDNSIIADGAEGTGYLINMTSVDALVNAGRDYTALDVLSVVHPDAANGETTAATIRVDTVTAATEKSTIDAQDETNFTGGSPNGSFTAGANYQALDVITMDDGTSIIVDTVDGSGGILTFDIDSPSITSFLTGATLTQSATSRDASAGALKPAGTGFTLTTDTNNEQNLDAIATYTLLTAGDYLFAPPTNVTVTGGTGTAATFDVTIEGELVTVVGGTFTTAGTLRPTEVSATGVVLKADIVDRGTYTVFPASPAATTAGTGTGLQVDLFINGDTGELWDSSILETGFDASEFSDLSDPDYLTIERGSCEGSIWARTNRWINVDIVNIATTLGQIIDASIVAGGINYVVGDQLPVDGDGINGVITVTAVDGSGTITSIRVSGRGQGYSFGGVDQTGATGTTDTVLWDATDATPSPSGDTWDVSFEWDEVITSGGGEGAIIDITLASAIDRSTKGERPILEFRRDLQLYDFGNKFLFEIQVVADTELYADVVGLAPGVVIDGVELKDGMKMIFLDPSQIPNFFQWDQDPDSGTPGASYWDTFAWEAEGAAGAVSRYIWEVQISGGTISLIKVDPVTGLANANADPVPEGGIVLATLGNDYAGDSFFQYRDPIDGDYTWRQCQVRDGVNSAPLYELYDYNGVQLADELVYENSDFDGNELFSYRILTAADIQDTGGALVNDAVLGFPLTLGGLRQISDIVFENDLETNRVLDGTTEIPGYYFYKEWDADPYCNIRTDTDGQISAYKTNWLTSDEEETQRIVDRFLTTSDTEDTFLLSAIPSSSSGLFDVRVEEGRRLNTDEFAYIPSTGQVKIFEKPTDTGFDIADGTDSLYAFSGIVDPAEVYVNGVYQERDIDYIVIESVQLDEATVNFGGTGYTVNDTIEVVGGTTTNPAQLRVVSVDGFGAITGVFISNRGVYASPPSSPFAVSGGTGNSASITGVFIDATANTFTIQFIDEDGNGEVQTSGDFIEARQQGSGAPGDNVVVEIQYASDGSITDEDNGFWQIPFGLQNNPNNLEIMENSWSEFTPHMVSIIENQDIYLGTAFGSVNNYRDTAKDGSEGTYILQSQAPLLKAMLASSSSDLDIIEALRYNSKEYARYKNKFVKEANNLINQGFTPFNDGDSIPVDQWVDEALRRIIRSREYATAFEDTYMMAYGTVYEEETFDFVSTVTSGTTTRSFNTLVNFIDLSDKRNVMYVYVDSTIQRVDVDYIISNDNPIEIEWINVPSGLFTVTIRLYENMAPTHIPATPQKLGLAPIFQPRVMLDESYQAPISVLLNHDGSRTPLYNDYRDDLMFEFETRIYNGILDQFRNDYTPPLEEDTYKPAKYRTTRWDSVEWNRLLRPSFFKWVASSKADYISNEFYDVSNAWTYNYSSIVDGDGNTLPGYWRGIFDYYYDTQTPHVTPWEMLGFSSEPDYWATEYGTGPWANTHPMWADLESGTIKGGYRAGIDLRYARPGLTTNSIPVDVVGTLLSTPLLCIANDGSLSLPSTVNAAKNWAYGDIAPVEYAWRIGEEYSFAVSEAMFLARPGEYGEKFWDPEHTFTAPANENQIVSDDGDVYKRVGNDTLTVHGETIAGVKQVNTGWQIWVSSRLRALNKNLGNDFGQLVRTLDVKLGHKMASFTNKDTLTVLVEGISVESQANNLLIPNENITVSLHTSPPVREYVYGGVLIRAQADGTYQIFGYDILNGEFNYIPREDNNKSSNVNVGGQPEPWTVWQSGTTYELGKIVRFNSIYYRALETHSNTSFDQTQWAKLSKLPIVGGVNVTYKPNGSGLAQIQYGAELNSIQEVFDLIISYGQWLEQEGWEFSNVNPESGGVENWLSAGKQFLLWTQTNWEAGSIVMISPAATGALLNVSEGYPAAVEKITNGVYSILDKNGVVIDPRNTIIKRDGRSIQVLPAIEQVGVYGARINTTDTESIITFDNVTDFNDTLYDPLLGSRLARLTFNGKRTQNWTGKLEAGGYIITENGLIPNFENLVDSIRFYHDTETILDNPDTENAARHLIGFSERDYYEDLQIEGDSQYQFYQGAIRQKGTVQAIRKLERSSKVGDATRDTEVFEEWALKTGEFGNVCGNQTVEFFIQANEVKVDPQLVQLSYPRSNIAGNKSFFTNADISGNNITITAHGFTTGDNKLYSIPAGETGTITNLTNNTIYSVIVVDANTISLALITNPTVAIAIVAVGAGTDVYSLNTPINGTVSNINIVSKVNTYTLVPTVTLTNHSDDTIGTGATAQAVLNTDGTLLRIDVLNPGYGYSIPPLVNIGDNVIETTDDRAIAELQFDITEDIVDDDTIVIDIDDNVRWPTQPTGIACNINATLWPTIAEQAAYTLPNSGNVSILDTNFSYVSTAGLDALSTLASPPSEKGETIHVAYGENEDFAVYLLNNLNATTETLAIASQLSEDNTVYANGRVILNTNLSSIGEDNSLSDATLTFSTNGSGEVSNVAITDTGYGYWEESSITISVASDSLYPGPVDYAVIPITNVNGRLALNIAQTIVAASAQNETDYTGIGEKGTFVSGLLHANLDVLTMSNGATIQVDNNVGGVVTQFTVLTAGSSFIDLPELTLVSSTGLGTEFTLTVGAANVELAATIGSGYSLSLTDSEISSVDIPGATQSGRYLRNVVAAGTGQLYVDNILYDYEYTQADTATGVLSVGRGVGYAIDDELSINGGFTLTSPALINVDSIRTIEGQTSTSFDGVSPNGSFVAGTGYAAFRNPFTAGNVDAASDQITITTHGYTTGDSVVLREGTTVPVGLADNTIYYIIVIDDDIVQFASSATNATSGVAIDITGAGAGVNSLSDTIVLDDSTLITVDTLAVSTIAAQDEGDFNGAGFNGTFTAGKDYAASNTITLADNTLITVDTIGATSLQTIVGQNQNDFDNVGSNGTFSAGAGAAPGYNEGDTITLSDGTVLQVNQVDVNEDVEEFEIISASTSSFTTASVLTQVATTGLGTTFTLTTDTNNETAFGDVATFTVTTAGDASNAPGDTVAQSTTTGSGTGFTVTLDSNNEDSTLGVVSDFTIYTSGNALEASGSTLRQAQTTDVGVGFELTLASNNEEILDVTLTSGGDYTVRPEIIISDHTSLAFSNTANTITRTGGTSFITQGFGVGQRIVIADAEDPTNDGTYTITAVTSTVITVDEDIAVLNAADTTASLRTETSSVVTVNGGTGTGATFTLEEFRPLYDISKDGVAVEDATFADNTEFFVLSNIRYNNTTNRDNFAVADLASGSRTVWIDDNGEGVWEVQNVTAPLVAAQTEADFDLSWTEGTGDHGNYAGGTNHAGADTITLSNGATITVDTVSADGVVTGFTIATVGSNVQHGDILDQTSTDGSGIAFSITVDSHNLDSSAITYTQREIQDTLIDTEKFKNAFVYEQATGDTISQLPVYDPFKGLIPGNADLNLTWKTRHDPARYNNAADDRLISESRLFDGDQVGLLWWDLSTCAYLYYEQGTDQYRRDNWGRLIDGSSIDVYEWTRSSTPPSSYTGDGTVRSTTDYVLNREYDRTLEEVRTFYYFWVKDRTVVPEGVERTIAAFEVARTIANPASQLYQWFSPISQNAFMFAGVEGSFTDSDNILQINYRRTEDEDRRHVEWQLGREGDPDYDILDMHWDKMVDSLCGFTDLIDIGNVTNVNSVATFLTDSSGVADGTEIITTDADHGFTTGQGVFYSNAGGVEDIGLSDGVMYYVNNLGADTLSLHATVTNAIGDASRIDLTAAGAETHTLTGLTTDLANFDNALPSAGDATKGYLVVPDPTLSATELLGIATRPLQTMFDDMFGARRIFVDKVNELMQYVNLRDEVPTWNSSMTTNNLWDWVDWYAVGYDADNTIPTFQVSAVNAMDDITQIIDGDIVRVTGTRWRLFEYDADGDTFVLVAREASRLQLSTDIYTKSQNLPDAIELRELIAALKDNVFVTDRFINNNLIFFALLNYVFSEQDDLNWAFKTTYVFLKQQGRTLQQDRVYQNDPFDAALEFINESKPYQTKIRDFRTERSAEIDLVPGTAEELVRDFTVSMVYDRMRGGDLSVAEMRIAKFELQADNRWNGYTTRDSGTTLVRLGAAGRYLFGQPELTDIADVDSDILEAYTTPPTTATIEFDVLGSGIVDGTSIVIVDGGEGYYAGGTFLITDASGAAGNGTAQILFTVDTTTGRGVINTAALITAGAGYTPGASYTVALTDLPAITSAAITTDELEAVAAINARITDVFAFDFEGLFIQNTEFTGNPSLISAAISVAGTGYTVGDILTLDAGSGSPISNAIFRVVTVGGGGDITELQLINGGSYQQTPTVDPVLLLGGTGTLASVTNLLFETGSTVPFDSTPHDQIGWDSSVLDPSVTSLEGTPLNLYRTILGQDHTDFDSGTNEGSFVGGTGYAALEQITMNDGTNVQVDSVSGGIVTQFTIAGGSTTSNISEATLTATSSDGAGNNDFTLTLGTANQTSANFFDVPAEETFNGTGTQKEFTLTTTVPTVFLFVVVDGVEQRLNVDYFFIADTLYFLVAPAAGTNNVQVYTYIEAGDLINPQVREGVTEEMVPLDPRENLVIRVDTVDVTLAGGGSTYTALDEVDVVGGTSTTPMTIRVDAVDGGNAITAFTVIEQGDYTVYPSSPVSVDSGAATFTITPVSFTIHEDTQNATNYYRNEDASSTTLLSNVNPADNVISIADSVPLDPQPDWDTPALAWVGTELVQYHGVDATYSVSGIAINAPGTGYTAGDILTVEGNTTGPTSNTLITIDTVGGSGEITGASLTVPGAYKETPGTTAVAVTAGSIIAQDETNFDGAGNNGTWNPGSGYVAADTITLDDGTVVTVDVVDVEAQFTFDTNGSGEVTGVTIVDGGSGYVSGGNFTITVASDGGFVAGTAAVITYTVSGGSIDAITNIGTNSGYTFSLVGQAVASSDVTDPTAGGVQQFTITSITTSASEADAASTDITLDQSSTSGGGSGFTLVLNLDNQSGDENATFDLTVSATGSALIGVRRGYRGTHPQTFVSGQKVFSAADGQLISNPEVLWTSSITTASDSDVTGEWRFVGVTEGGRSSIHFYDAAGITASVGETLVVTDADVGFKYLVTDNIVATELSIIDITAAGTGYEVGDVIDIHSVATAGSDVTAEVGAVNAAGGIVYVRITDRGTGYTDVGAVAVTDTEIASTNGAGATMNAYFDRAALECALPDRILDVAGIIASKSGLTWQVDSVTYGLADPDAGNLNAISVFLRNGPGNAL